MNDAVPAGVIPGFTSTTATVDGVRLHYWIGGDPKGQPMLLWHGFLSTGHAWSRVAWTGDAGAATPAPAVVQATRTEIGRPLSSMRLSAWTATSTSVARRRSVHERSPSPITCLNLPMAASARARLVQPDAFCQAARPCSAIPCRGR